MTEQLQSRMAFVDSFDQAWGERWRPARWAEVIDRLYGQISTDELARLAEGAPTWDSFIAASGAAPAEWSPSDGPHDQWGNPIEERIGVPDAHTPTHQFLANEYVAQLTGRTPERNGLVKCPFHKDGQERTASLSLNGAFWHCFGCDAGGTVIDFAGLLWNLDTKGGDYLEIKRRLHEAGII